MAVILGIETSCDETAAALVASNRRILSNVISSHVEEHQPFGGVVPEISSRAHLNRIEGVIQQAFKDAGMQMKDIDAIAVTAGPGLIGGVIVGVMTAKAMASVLGKPLIAINHLEGHALTTRLTDNTPYPYLLVLMSGGHCQFLIVHDLGKYSLLGETLDDALGECFDKVAKMLGLGYPGGPALEKLALQGRIDEKLFPIPMLKHEGCDLSFSGLKTSVRQLVNNSLPHRARTGVGALLPTEPQLSPPHLPVNGGEGYFAADIAASFQWTATEAVALKLERAMQIFKDTCPDALHVVLAGGVAANQYIRKRLQILCEQYGMTLNTPPVKLCTDNAAMIAWAGCERFASGLFSDADFEPRARWGLSNPASGGIQGGGSLS